MPAQETPVERWSDFEGNIRSLAPIPENNSRPWLFRGLGNSCWDLKTTLERSYPDERSFLNYYRKIFAAKPALETFTGRRWEIPDPPAFQGLLKDDQYASPDIILNAQHELYEYLVYLRHHAFPSQIGRASCRERV